MRSLLRSAAALLRKGGRILKGHGIPLLLAGILLLAFLIRLGFARQGLPYLHHEDEPRIANAALEMLLSGDYDPHFYRYGSLPIYLSLGVDLLHYFYLMGRPEDHPPFLRHLGEIQVGRPDGTPWFVSHPSFYLWNRALWALLGAGTVFFLYRAGRSLAGPRAALLAALLLAGLEDHARHTARVTPDGPAAFLVLGTVLLSLRYLEDGDPSYLLGALVGVGWTAATKVNAAVVGVVPFLALALAELQGARGRRWWLWPALLLVPLASFAVASPYALLRLPTFLDQVGSEVRHYRVLGHGIYTVEPGLPHLREILLWLRLAFGRLLLLFALAGGLFLLRSLRGGVVWAFPLTYLLLMTDARVFFPRNLVPLYPFVALAAGVGIDRTWAVLKAKGGRWGGRGAWLLLLPLLILAGRTALHAAATGTRPETRSRAMDRLNALGGPEARIGIAAELRLHPQDLGRLRGRYGVQPLEDLACAPYGYDLLLLPAHLQALDPDLREEAVRLERLLPPPEAALEAIPGDDTAWLDRYMMNPEVRIFAPRRRPWPRPPDCPETALPPEGRAFALDELLGPNPPYPREGKAMVLAWNGQVSTPFLPLPPGRYRFVWESWGSPAAGRLPSLQVRLQVLTGDRLEDRIVRTWTLTVEPRTYTIPFSLADRAVVSLQWRFEDDFFDPATGEDRNVWLQGVQLLPGPSGE